MTDRHDVAVEMALRDLGAHLAVPAPPDVTASVLARLEQPAPHQMFGGSRLLKAAAVILVVLVALGVLITVSPPVRAGVLNLLRFAGIEFSESAPPGPLPLTPAPLPGERAVDLPTAQQLSRFPIALPAELGTPERVLVADGTPPRIVSLIYRGGTVRVDEFDGRLDYAVFKKVAGGDFRHVDVGGTDGIWVTRPHEVIYVDREGRYRTESARLSAKTLIWQVGDVTLRLEGDFTLDQALAIAESVS